MPRPLSAPQPPPQPPPPPHHHHLPLLSDSQFYKYVAGAFDEPRYRLHFAADAPIALRCLFFVGRSHTEKFGLGERLDPGCSLYSKKVLITSKMENLLPEWMRFFKGVVDSEDIPLNISRESMQDSAIIRKIRTVLTGRLMKFLADRLRRDREGYVEFFDEFGTFLKEGAVTDWDARADVSKLLMFESSKDAAGTIGTFDEYIARCPPEQKNIYYLCGSSREQCESSPYYEDFKRNNVEVLFLYHSIDEFVMSNVAEYNGRKLVSAEASEIDLAAEGARGAKDGDAKDSDNKDGDDKDGSGSDANDGDTAVTLGRGEQLDLEKWMQEVLGEQVTEVKTTTRLVGSPAIITNHESAAVRRMMKMVQHQTGGTAMGAPASNQQLEINPSHPIIRGIHETKDRRGGDTVARLATEQVLDNALIAAGLVEDPREMLPRLNQILAELLSVEDAAAKVKKDTKEATGGEAVTGGDAKGAENTDGEEAGEKKDTSA